MFLSSPQAEQCVGQRCTDAGGSGLEAASCWVEVFVNIRSDPSDGFPFFDAWAKCPPGRKHISASPICPRHIILQVIFWMVVSNVRTGETSLPSSIVGFSTTHPPASGRGSTGRCRRRTAGMWKDACHCQYCLLVSCAGQACAGNVQGCAGPLGS